MAGGSLPAVPGGLFERPVFILAAPRSGSTLLYETLAEAPEAWTVGGESHQFIEGLRPLSPRYGEVDSNRLEARHATEPIIQRLRLRYAGFLRDRDGNAWRPDSSVRQLRFLEKTPKNALRLPFLEQVFPGAFYIFLYRDPAPNLSSMMEAWKSGRWVTYPRLPGWKGPGWSLLLPPGWQEMNGRPLAEICAFQWARANQIVLDDLEALPAERWTACRYSDLTERPGETIRRICAQAGFTVDERLAARIDRPLPLSGSTQSAPKAEKWRRNETAILKVLDSVSDVWARCEALQA